MSEPTVDSSLRCRYCHSLCQNPRTTKCDGSLHQLCKMHQDRANYNQRIFVARRMARQRKLTAIQYPKRKSTPAAIRERPGEQVRDYFTQRDKEARELAELNAALLDASHYTVEFVNELEELLQQLDITVDQNLFNFS